MYFGTSNVTSKQDWLGQTRQARLGLSEYREDVGHLNDGSPRWRIGEQVVVVGVDRVESVDVVVGVDSDVVDVVVGVDSEDFVVVGVDSDMVVVGVESADVVAVGVANVVTV